VFEETMLMKVRGFIDDAKERGSSLFARMLLFTELPESFHSGNILQFSYLK
jgi:hypothetical protein